MLPYQDAINMFSGMTECSTPSDKARLVGIVPRRLVEFYLFFAQLRLSIVFQPASTSTTHSSTRCPSHKLFLEQTISCPYSPLLSSRPTFPACNLSGMRRFLFFFCFCFLYVWLEIEIFPGSKFIETFINEQYVQGEEGYSLATLDTIVRHLEGEARANQENGMF